MVIVSIICLKPSDIYQKNGLIRRVQAFFGHCCLALVPTGFTFQRETGTKKAIHLTMITTYGIQPGGFSDDIQSQVTMNDLFVE